MHTQLNSLILEGRIIGTKQYDGAATDGGECTFAILSMRGVKGKDGLPDVATVQANCVANGKLAQTMNETDTNRREIRIVGRLVERDERIWIECEHVEFKPRSQA